MLRPEVFRNAIEEASGRIAPYIRHTPTIALNAGDLGVPSPVCLKLECLQHTGSFKARGAFNRLLSNDVPAAGVIAASGGNHGIAIAYAAQILGHKADIFVPEISSPVKVQRLRDYGANVNIVGATYAEALALWFTPMTSRKPLRVRARQRASWRPRKVFSIPWL